jgi:hypothetical protein
MVVLDDNINTPTFSWTEEGNGINAAAPVCALPKKTNQHKITMSNIFFMLAKY